MSQAIITKFIPATNTHPARIKATGWRDSVTVSYNGEISPVNNYRAAVQTLCDKFIRMDRATWKIIEYAELPNEPGDFVFIIDWVTVP